MAAAYDTSLGADSQFGGRFYVAYTQAVRDPAGNIIDSDVYVTSSDNPTTTSAAGPTWSVPVRINDDAGADNFSEGGNLTISTHS